MSRCTVTLKFSLQLTEEVGIDCRIEGFLVLELQALR